MDMELVIAQLKQQLAGLNESILSLERLAAMIPREHVGSAPKWLAAAQIDQASVVKPRRRSQEKKTVAAKRT